MLSQHHKPLLTSARIKSILLIALVLGFAVYVNVYTPGEEFIRQYAASWGYPALFALAALSGFNLLFPIPLISFYPFLLEVGFDPLLIIVVISLGMVFGDLVGYILGAQSRNLVTDEKKHPFITKLETWMNKGTGYPPFIMFIYAAVVPMPNELLVIPMAFLRVPWWQIGIAIFFGNIIFNTLGAFGVTAIF